MAKATEYRALEKYPGYRFGTDGSLWSCKATGRRAWTRCRPWRRLRTNDIDSKGYTRVTLYVRGKRFRPLLHRLVALAFLPNPENKPGINHIDGNKRNPCVSNLEWVTQSENSRHSFDVLHRKGTAQVGEENGRAKLDEAAVIAIRKRAASGARIKTLVDDFGVSYTLVKKIIKRELWTHI